MRAGNNFWLTLSGQGCPMVTKDVGKAIRLTIHASLFVRYDELGKVYLTKCTTRQRHRPKPVMT